MQIMEIGISGEAPYSEMREYAKQFEKKLRDVRGVSRLERFGFLAKEIQIEISPEKIKQYHLPLHEIIMAIQARNIRTTAGNFESYTSEKTW